MFNLCLKIAHFNIYTEAKESELYSFLVFKAFLKHKLSTEPSGIWESLSLQPYTFGMLIWFLLVFFNVD